jgi:hypothetical protein
VIEDISMAGLKLHLRMRTLKERPDLESLTWQLDPPKLEFTKFEFPTWNSIEPQVQWKPIIAAQGLS